ncbi:MAG: exonuclease SbcCD subunit D [Meiothermus sp.]|nr:exonuclease SbcCD subunit D [Meiothermus sp.]
MRILHTADWHLGKTLKGQDRTPEVHEALKELLGLVSSERVELVLVSGDLFDRSVVSSAAEAAAFEFFVGLKEKGIPALVIAGNHDSRERLEALAPLLALTGTRAYGNLRFAQEGGVVEVGGLRVAMLPFLSERRLVKAQQLLQQDTGGWRQTYAEGMRQLIAHLTAPGVRLLMAHLTVEGAQLGGGEFTFHTTNSYAVLKGHLPPTLGYVALGHIHKQQKVSDGPVAWYPGSLIQLDFGEGEGAPRGALLVELEPGKPARVHEIPGRWGKPLKTFRLRLEDLDRRWEELREFPGYTKLVLEGQGNPALRKRLFEEVPRLLDVEFQAPSREGPSPPASPERLSWSEAYAQYRRETAGEASLDELLKAFQEVLEEVLAPR